MLTDSQKIPPAHAVNSLLTVRQLFTVYYNIIITLGIYPVKVGINEQTETYKIHRLLKMAKMFGLDFLHRFYCKY